MKHYFCNELKHKIMKNNTYDETGNTFEDEYSEVDVEFLLLFARLYKEGKINDDAFHQIDLYWREWFNSLGAMYEDGIGVEQDLAEANYWYEQALEHGNDYLAACNLGDNLRKGRGIEKNLERAFEVYSHSTHPYALYRIGEAYEHGWGTQQDQNLAHYYYLDSARAGHRLACKRCEELGLDYKSLSGISTEDDEEEDGDNGEEK